MNRSRAQLIAAATAALAVAAAAPASASASASGDGVISYIKNANVYTVKPDGSGLHQVTSDGSGGGLDAYHAASWAPDGTLWAGRGTYLVHLNQAGQKLGEISAPPLKWAPGATVPFDVEVSPDGTKAAYTMVGMECKAGCRSYEASGVVDLSSGAQLLPDSWSDVESPAWVTNSRLLGSAGAGRDFTLRDVGSSDEFVWFNDPSTDVSDSTISADHKSVAFVSSTGYAVTASVQGGDPATGNPAGPLSYSCGFGPNGVTEDVDPVFAPDSRTLAFAETDGIAVVPDAVQADMASCGALVPRIRYIGEPGARGPDWGAVAYDITPAGGGGGGSTGGDGSTGGGSTPGGSTPGGGDDGTPPPPPAASTPKVKVASASRSKGVVVKITGAAPGGKAAGTLTLKRRKLGKGTARVGSTGSATLKVKLGKAARRQLRKGTRAKLKLTLPDQAAKTLTVKFR